MPGEVASCPVLVCERSSIALLKGQEGKEDLNHGGHVAAVGHDEFTRIWDKRTREEMHLLPRFCVPVRLAPTAECAAGETRPHERVRTCLELLGVHSERLALSLAFPVPHWCRRWWCRGRRCHLDILWGWKKCSNFGCRFQREWVLCGHRLRLGWTGLFRSRRGFHHAGEF